MQSNQTSAAVKAPWKTDLFIKAVTLHGFIEAVESLGGDADALLAGAGLSRKALRDSESLLNWESVAQVLNGAAQSLSRPDFGVHWAIQNPDDHPHTGPAILMGIISPDVRTLIELYIKYHKSHTNAAAFRVAQDALGHVSYILALSPSATYCRTYFDRNFMAIAGAARKHLRPPFDRPLWIEFAHSAPPDRSVYEAFCGCEVRFDQLQNAIVFPPGFLDVKIGGLLRGIRPLMDRYISRRVRNSRVGSSSVAASTAEVVLSSLGLNASSKDVAAKALGLGPKTLQRALQEEGTSYAEILDQVREMRARWYLEQSDVSIALIAERLDYASAVAFNAAFRRWTGQSPTGYRKACRATAAVSS